MAHRLRFHDSPQGFLDAADGVLAAAPVLTTVVATVTARLARGALPAVSFDRWWLTVHDTDRAGEPVVGLGMRTAPFAPHPLYLLAMPDDAARQLARVLHERGPAPTAVNGVLPAARLVAEETARSTGGRAETAKHTRLFELSTAGDLVAPARPAPGRLVRATRDDLPLVVAWFEAFHTDAAEQAGRPPSEEGVEQVDEADVLVRIDEGVVGLWVVDDAPVSLTAWNPPAHGVVRVGPVYTPSAHRGRGYGGSGVAEASRLALASGHRCCLFTDQANPTSNRLYESLGYRRVADLADLVVRPADLTTPGPA